ncbi:MAG: hypothetical protein JW862_10885 [Anaerolineales bacterium]|nr:hypothetical protein [Anaerolineales bacterium]
MVGAPFQDGTIWAVALEDGQVQVFQVDAEGGSKGLGRKYLYRLVCPQYW